MIRVSLTSMVLVLVCTSAGIVLLLWLLNEWRRFRQNAHLQKRARQCPLCFFEFLQPNESPLASCPRCGAPTD
jgi:uncharacterized paraquat-inducible protein A